MTEYIEKDDAYKIISDFQYERLKDGKSHISLSELGKITLLMSELPTIDIVHCKDCKHYNYGDCVSMKFRAREEDWYCADGERKE